MAAYLEAHRGWTHGPILLVAWAVLAAWLFGRGRPPRERLAIGLAGAASVAVHILLDITNAFGAMPFMPFSDRRFAIDWVYIIDPVFFGVLAVSIGLAWARPRHASRVARVGLGLAAAYVGLCGVNHAAALDRVRAMAGERLGPDAVRRAAAFPMYPHAFAWRGLVDTGTDVHELRFSLLGGGPVWRVPWPAARRVEAEVPPTADKAGFDRVARFPAAFVRAVPDGTEYRFVDRQFQVVPGRSIYQLTQTVDAAGRVTASRFSDSHVPARLALFVLLYLLAALATRRWLREERSITRGCQDGSG